MTTRRVFISSVQKEFAAGRAAIRDWLRADPLMRRFFEPVLFEDLPAADRRADDLYLDEVERCAVYVGLFGSQYGSEDIAGLSPTEREFDHATALRKTRLIFVGGAPETERHPKMQALIRKADAQVVRRRFRSHSELIGSLYAALVQYLENAELIRNGPFDAAPCRGATLTDLDDERMATFVRRARQARSFPLPEEVTPTELLTQLNLLANGTPSNAAVLLFGRQPQRFLISSEIKCAHFHGTTVAKPIPSYQVYKGSVFDLVDQAVDFVMSKINLAVGTRAESTAVPVAYEIPPEVVREAIVNAVAHRDYTSNGSVQVMLFADRLEIWNPGGLPPGLTLDMLQRPHGSVPGNPLLAEPLYLAKYIERMGTGIGDMIEKCREAGLPAPRFEIKDGFVTTLGRMPGRALAEVAPQETPQVTTEVATEVATEVRLLSVLRGEMTRQNLQAALSLKNDEHFRKAYLLPALDAALIEMTKPDKPTSRLQRYRLTAKGTAVLKSRGESGS